MLKNAEPAGMLKKVISLAVLWMAKANALLISLRTSLERMSLTKWMKGHTVTLLDFCVFQMLPKVDSSSHRGGASPKPTWDSPENEAPCGSFTGAWTYYWSSVKLFACSVWTWRDSFWSLCCHPKCVRQSGTTARPYGEALLRDSYGGSGRAARATGTKVGLIGCCAGHKAQFVQTDVGSGQTQTSAANRYCQRGNSKATRVHLSPSWRKLFIL